MNWSNVKLIFLRELRDQLRDRRTLFMIAVLPLLLYPLIGMSFMQMTQFLKKHKSNVLILIDGQLPDSPPLISDGQLGGDEAATSDSIAITVEDAEGKTQDQVRDYASTLVQKGKVDAVVWFPRALTDQLAQLKEGKSAIEEIERQRETTGIKAPAEPEIFFSMAKDQSRITRDRVAYEIRAWRARLVEETIEDEPITRWATEPFAVAEQDVAQPVRRRAALWSKMLPFVLLMWALTGAFYPAVDLCAGEKERGTLETLLVSPAARIDIVWGKLLTIMVFSMATAVLNLLCMTFTASMVVHQFSGMLGGSQALGIGPPPIASIGWLLLLLVPISALFSALSLSLAAMARSTKEGQYYLMPLLMLIMPLMMLPMMPSAQLDPGTSLIPVTGVILLLRQLMEGDYGAAFVYAIPVLFVTGLCCMLAIRWAVDQFNDESVLFRESERLEPRLLLKQMIANRGPTPTAGAALLCGVLVLLLRFFVGLMMPIPEDWSTFFNMTLIALIGMIALPAVLMSFIFTTNPEKTLLLSRTNPSAIVAAALLAIFLHPVALALSLFIRQLYPVDVSALGPLAKLMGDAPSILHLIVLMAIAPAICEELAFRGFILSGLRHMGNKWRAIAITSLLFGLAHGMLQQSLVATVMGFVLGYIAVQTQSLWPCILFHATNNTLAILAGEGMQWVHNRLPSLAWLLEDVSKTVEGPAEYTYRWPLIVVGGVLSLLLLKWFHALPYAPSAEERLHDALERQSHAVSL